MKKLLILFLLLLNLTFIYAKGVSAGTVIKNSATLDFIIGSESYNVKSNILKNIVDQLIDIKVSWMDTSEVIVRKGDEERVLTFKVLNSGNARDSFNLTANILKNRSDFKLKRKKIYIDSNSNLYFDSKDRMKKTVTLGEDEESLVFVVSDIPKKVDSLDQSKNYINFKAISQKGGSGVRGKIYRKKGINKTDAVDGLNGGIGEDEGVYKLLTETVSMYKNVIFKDGLIIVSIEVTLNGKCSIKNFSIKDDIPNETRYVKNSLALDGIPLSDKRDKDRGQFKRKKGDSEAYIKVKLGEVSILDHFTITYNLKV